MKASKIVAAVVWVALACFSFVSKSQATAPTITNLSPNFGTVGSTVKVYGTNFGSSMSTGYSIKFNGVSATATSWTNTVITVTVPSTTTGTVEVTTPGGSFTTSVDFNVLSTDGALLMGVTPQAATCPGLPAGNNCITQYGQYVLPNTDGIVIVVPWAEIETSEGSYSWTWLDNAVANYTGQTAYWSASNKIGIVLAPVGDGGNNDFTPSYVFSESTPQDQCTCNGYPGGSGAPTHDGCWNATTSNDTSGFPAVWETPFQTALQNFWSNAMTYLNSTATYHSSISYIRLGLAGGGEEFPWCSANLSTLTTNLKSSWIGNASTMFTYAAGLDSEIPLMAAPNGGQNATVDYTWADAEASDATSNGLNLGSEGFQSNDTFSPTHCSNDWCYTFSTYAPPITELQTLTASEPQDNTCTTNYGTMTPTTGSLVCLLPYAEGKSNVDELYNVDMFIAYDSNNSNYSTYHTAYATAISNARTGH